MKYKQKNKSCLHKQAKKNFQIIIQIIKLKQKKIKKQLKRKGKIFKQIMKSRFKRYNDETEIKKE